MSTINAFSYNLQVRKVQDGTLHAAQDPEGIWQGYYRSKHGPVVFLGTSEKGGQLLEVNINARLFAHRLTKEPKSETALVATLGRFLTQMQAAAKKAAAGEPVMSALERYIIDHYGKDKTVAEIAAMFDKSEGNSKQIACLLRKAGEPVAGKWNVAIGQLRTRRAGKGRMVRERWDGAEWVHEQHIMVAAKSKAVKDTKDPMPLRKISVPKVKVDKVRAGKRKPPKPEVVKLPNRNTTEGKIAVRIDAKTIVFMSPEKAALYQQKTA
jgi:hypothetical protein